MKLSKKQKSYAFYIVLALVLLISCSSGNSESTYSFTEWYKQPISGLSVIELFFVLVVAGLITS